VVKNHEVGELDGDVLVQFIELTLWYISLKTTADHVKFNKLSYNGIKIYLKSLLNLKIKEY
jgi:hypothetical protein